MIVIGTGFISFSPLSVVSTMVIWVSSHWRGKDIVRSTSSIKKSRKVWVGVLDAAIKLKLC